MLLGYISSWSKIQEEFTDFSKQDKLKASVLICARNEVDHIGKCIQSLVDQNYNLEFIELILLDDFSTDNTVAIAQQFSQLKIIRLKDHLDESYEGLANKKRAISIGVKEAIHDIIITTDGDSVYPKNGLKAILQYYEKEKAKLITAPVLFYEQKNIFSKFLALDLISLMGITAAGIKSRKPSMVNGANLLFEKKIFEELNGYQGNEHVASGDDVFLMQKINKKYPDAIRFLKSKDAIVYTQMPQNFSEFVQQRIRWTSKSGRYADFYVKLNLIFNALFYLLLSSCLFILPILDFNYFLVALSVFILKVGLDFIFFRKLCFFFNKQYLLKSIVFIELLHLIYISVLSFLSFVKKYNWKGRKV